MPYLDFEKKFSDDFVDELRSRRESATPATEVSSAEMGARLTHAANSGGGFTGRDFERILGRNDLMPINYLSRGLMAAAAVGRVDVPNEFGGSGSFGTGFLISPRLMITNNHVIGSAEAAQGAVIEFGYERDASGNRKTSHRFRLDPASTFITSDKDKLDYTLVAVMAESDEDRSVRLDEFGFLRLEPGIHKVGEGEFVTIIQHPNGEEKFIAIRENKVLQIGAAPGGFAKDFLWYASDTAPGSSGAPAFNDGWQVVAVHHRGVPVTQNNGGAIEYQRSSGEWISQAEAEKLPDDLLRWEANEGVRVSSILADIRQQQQSPGKGFALVKDLLDDVDKIRPLSGRNEQGSIVSPIATSTSTPTEVGATLEASRRSSTGVHPVEYFAGRKGYDPNFLGQAIPLPTLTEGAMKFGKVAPIAGTQDNVLRYEHFSVVMNADRRLAFFTAVNIDGSTSSQIKRNDAWFFDGRLLESLQVGNDFYTNEPGGNFFDRGHLVRRLDPVWGDEATAARANEDSFHFTNCSPQYFLFNESETLWQGLENFILTNTDNDDLKTTVFTGPIFRDDDELHRGVLVPQAFWKLVAVKDRANQLFTSAYIVSQKKFAKNIPFEVLPVGEFNNFQVSIARLEELTGLAFDRAVRAADVIPGEPKGRPLRGLSDIKLPSSSSSGTESFGKFESFEAFITSYTQAQILADKQEESAIGLESRRKKMRQRRERDVVEIAVSVVKYLGIDNKGGDSHQQMYLNVTAALQDDPDIHDDLQRVIDGKEEVFLSVRFGDRMGLPQPVPGIKAGSELRVRGEWITKDKAYAHGGKKLSVIHFTHHPLGFICDETQCWE
jgi:endonuclease G, mitochondrial